MPTFEDVAKLAKRGMRCFPCEVRGKKPIIHDWPRRATCDLHILEGWWQADEFNIGLATGKLSGIWVLDLDGPEGEMTLRRLEDVNGPLPATVEAITGKGRHLYWRWPPGCNIYNRQVVEVLPGLDVRGEGGFVICPPSIHPSGFQYLWSVDSAREFADAPAWLLKAVTMPGQTSPSGEPVKTDWKTFIKDDVEASHRANALSKLAGLLLRQDVDLDASAGIIEIFNQARCKPPLDNAEVVKIIKSIGRKEANARRERDDA